MCIFGVFLKTAEHHRTPQNAIEKTTGHPQNTSQMREKCCICLSFGIKVKHDRCNENGTVIAGLTDDRPRAPVSWRIGVYYAQKITEYAKNSNPRRKDTPKF